MYHITATPTSDLRTLPVRGEAAECEDGLPAVDAGQPKGRCTKPDRKEFQKIAMATAIGFAIMGFIGFFVKLIHIPINNIIVGG